MWKCPQTKAKRSSQGCKNLQTLILYLAFTTVQSLFTTVVYVHINSSAKNVVRNITKSVDEEPRLLGILLIPPTGADPDWFTPFYGSQSTSFPPVTQNIRK